jgi:hypothetical protein
MSCECGYCSVTYVHCSQCGYVAHRRALVRVTDRATGHVRYVCRPSEGTCFSKNVRHSDLDTIEMVA